VTRPIASGVRRLSEVDNRSNSLVRILQEIDPGTEDFTLDWWISTAVPGDAEVCEHRFSELSRDGDAIDPRAVNRDRETVIAACERVKGYVDTHKPIWMRIETELTCPRLAMCMAPSGRSTTSITYGSES